MAVERETAEIESSRENKNHEESLQIDEIAPEIRPIQKRILVVDDEAYNLLAMTGLLKLLKKFPGLENLVDTASSGEEAV